MAARCSCRCPAPCPALARVAMMTMSSGKPAPSPLASISVAMGMRVLRSTVQTPSPTWLLSRTMYEVRSCSSCLFSCTVSSWSESLGGEAVMRLNQACSLVGSTQASWASEPHRHRRLGLGLFSAEGWTQMGRVRGENQMADFWKTLHGYLLSWNSLVKNFKTRLQNFADRLSLAVAIMICTNSPLQDKRKRMY